MAKRKPATKRTTKKKPAKKKATKRTTKRKPAKKRTTKRTTTKKAAKKAAKKKARRKTASAALPALALASPPPPLSRGQVAHFVYNFFESRSKFPPGTTTQNWTSVTMGQMLFDQPPLPANPHFEKRKLALEIQAWFGAMMLDLESPLEILKTPTKTMKDLWLFVSDNQTSG